jgi:hypothetical protein
MKMCAHEEDRLLEILDQGAKTAHTQAEETLRQMKMLSGVLRKGKF